MPFDTGTVILVIAAVVVVVFIDVKLVARLHQAAGMRTGGQCMNEKQKTPSVERAFFVDKN